MEKNEQGDSVIFEALKQAIVVAFFKQQYFYSPNGGSPIYYGGQLEPMIQDIMKLPKWKEMCDDIAKEVGFDKEKWKNLASSKFEYQLSKEAENYAKNWTVREDFQSAMNRVAREYALELMQKDERLKKQIEDTVGAGEYTVNLSVSVQITKKAPDSSAV